MKKKVFHIVWSTEQNNISRYIITTLDINKCEAHTIIQTTLKAQWDRQASNYMTAEKITLSFCEAFNTFLCNSLRIQENRQLHSREKDQEHTYKYIFPNVEMSAWIAIFHTRPVQMINIYERFLFTNF